MKKVLFVNQDILPYVEETEVSKAGRFVPQRIQEKKYEIRTFMPRWGNINERRGQLHEVIRLSGINICINDVDHPILIKVASIPASKVQVYFIDNEEFFSRKGQLTATEGKLYEDNGERAIFFTRGVLETIKKLRWVPDIIHCQGWFAGLAALYAKEAYKEELGLTDVKIVISLFEQTQQDQLQGNIKDCLAYNNVTPQYLAKFSDTMSSHDIEKLAIDNADGIIVASGNIDSDILSYAKDSGTPLLLCTEDDFAQAYADFYESLYK